MYKKILFSLIAIIVICLTGYFILDKTNAERVNLGAFGDPFISLQLATSPVNGKCLFTDGTNNYWDTCGTGTGSGGSNWGQIWTNALTPTSSTAGIFVKASSTFDSTLRVNSGLIVNSNATTTGSMTIGSLLNCNTIDTDANGLLKCGTDADTGAGTGSNWSWGIASGWIIPSTTVGVIISASSTISDLTVNNSTTTVKSVIGTDGAGDALISLKELWSLGFDDSDGDSFVISSGNALGTNNIFRGVSTGVSMPENATVTKSFTVSSLANCDTIDTDANGLFACGSDASGGVGDWATDTEQYFWNNTTTWNAYDTNWARNANATTTQTNFTPNWNALYNATTTQAGFATQFASYYNATTTQTNFTPNWNALHNATTTYPGFQTQFNTALNATSTLDLTTLMCTNATTTSLATTDFTVTGALNLPANGITDAMVSDTLTASWDLLTLKPATSSILNLLDTQYRIAQLYATSSIIDALYSTNARITTLNSTTTKVDTLVINTGTTFPANDITDADVSDTLTCSNLVAGSEVVADAEVVDALTINTSIEGIFTGNIRTNHLNATSSIIDALFSTGARIATINSTTTNIDTLTVNTAITVPADSISDDEINEGDTFEWTALHTFTDARPASLNATTSLIDTLFFGIATGTSLHLTELCLTNDCKTAWPTGGVASWDDLTNKPATSTILNLLDTQNRIAVLNATTTNIGTLKVYTALDFPANSITSAMMTTGWNALHNATTTYPGFQSQFNTALNATTTWAGFTPAWNTLFNATTTWSAFDTNWNRKANATTTYPGFASQFATAYNATTTQTNFTPNWNAVFNATTTWAGFTSNFNTLLNATTTLDLSTFSVGSGDAFTINSSGVASSTNTTTIGSMKCYKSPNQESHTTTCISI